MQLSPLERKKEKKRDALLFLESIVGKINRQYGISVSYTHLVKAAAGRVPVYAGVGGISTNEVVDLAKEMTAKGVDALSVITPYLIHITQEELIQHYEAIADRGV